MRPTRLFAKAYGPYHDVDWDVPAGVTAVLGRNDAGDGISSNGSGKTKLLEILPIALFGPQLSWSEYLSKSSEDATCEVGCEFEHAGDVYRVRRTFSAKGRGKSTLELALATKTFGSGPGMSGEILETKSLTRESQAETQAELERILGLTEATFQHSVFSKQGARHFADPELAPRERKEILAQALGLGVYDWLLEQTRGHLADVRSEVTQAEGALAATGDDLPTLEEACDAHKLAALDVEALTQGVQEAREAHDSLRGTYEQAKSSRERVEQAKRELLAGRAHETALQERKAAGERARDEALELSARLESLQDVTEQLETLTSNLSALRDAQQAREAFTRQRDDLLAEAQRERQQVLRLEADAADWGRRIERLEEQAATPPDVCDKCEQPLADAAAFLSNVDGEKIACEANREQRMEEARVARDTAAALVAQSDAIVIPPEVDTAEINATEGLIERLRADVTEAAVMNERLSMLTALVSAVDDVAFNEQLAFANQTVLAALEHLEEVESTEIPDGALQGLAGDVTGAQIELERKQTELQSARQWLGKAEALVEQVEAAQEKQRALRDRVLELTSRQEVLRTLESAYGRDGIPALIMESTAIPKIEREAERVLGEFGVPFRVELRTQAALKSADRMKDTLEVIVHEPRGERSYGSYSGGEQARVNVALRIALARLLAHRGGASIEMFALDEVEHLDAAGVTRLAELLKDLQREVPVVLLVSHVDALSDSFDNQVVVEKRDGVSKLLEV